MDEELIPQPQPALDVPQELILNIAMGMEYPREIASRYGFEGIKWEKLQGWKPFVDAVASKRAELETSGITFKIKAKALTEDVFEDAYKIARSNDATLRSISQHQRRRACKSLRSRSRIKATAGAYQTFQREGTVM